MEDVQFVYLENIHYNMCDFICVPSEFARKTFIDKGLSEDKIIKIPYGVNLKEFYRDKEIRKKN